MADLLDVNGDVIEKFHYDEMEGRSVVETVQDVAPYLDQNQREKNNQSSGWKGGLHKVASIPLVLIQQWNKEYGCNVLEPKNRHLIMAKLNDKDYSKLRTKDGRI